MSEKEHKSITRPLRITLVTQDDPFFLGESFEYFFSKLPENIIVASCVLMSASPFGKKQSFIAKLKKTYSVFGLSFCAYYGFNFILSKLKIYSTVAAIMQHNNVEVIRLTKSINHPASLDAIKSHSPDVLVSIAGNEIFKKPLIDLAPSGFINLHSALLPKYRGLMPSFWVLHNKESETGVSVFFVNNGIDTGPILVQKRFDINGMSQRDLIINSKKIGMEAICEALIKIQTGQLETMPNEDSEATYYSFPKRSDAEEFRRAGARFF